MRVRPWTGICQRCFKERAGHIMSMFNTDLICLDCSAKESKHSDYQSARDAESEAIKSGNLNFKGVGKPSDL